MLDRLFTQCDKTFRDPAPCYLPEYMKARYAYHQEFVKQGMLDPKLADKKPKEVPHA